MMYAVNGSVPAQQLAEAVERIRLNPHHPGEFIRRDCVGYDGVDADKAASLLGVSRQQLDAVMDGAAPVTPRLAQRLEKIGWSSARLWSTLQAKYDQAQSPAKAAAARAEAARAEHAAPPP